MTEQDLKNLRLQLQNETREETFLRRREWERIHTTRGKPPYYNVEFCGPPDHQSFIEGVGCEAVWVCPLDESDFLSHLWETRTKSLLWLPGKRSLFWAIMRYQFSGWIFWILYIASMGVIGTIFFLMVSLQWYLKIVVFLVFLIVSFIFLISYSFEHWIDIEKELMQRLTSACVSDKEFYLGGLEKKWFKLVARADWGAK